MKLLTIFCYGYYFCLTKAFTDAETLRKVDDQNRELQLSQLKTSNIGLHCYTKNKMKTNDLFFVVCLTDERRLAYFQPGISGALQAEFEPAQNQNSGLVE